MNLGRQFKPQRSLQQEREGKREFKNAKSQFPEDLCKVSKILKVSHLCAMVTAHISVPATSGNLRSHHWDYVIVSMTIQAPQ